VNWALSDLFRAGLLDRPSRGLYVITNEGTKIAQENPPMIDRAFLVKISAQFAALQEGTGAKKSEGQDTKPLDVAGTDKTPEELIDSAFEQLNATLRKDILDVENGPISL
jgi:restriction system protein